MLHSIKSYRGPGRRVFFFFFFLFLFNVAKVRAMIVHNATELVQGLSNVVRVLVHPDGGGETQNSKGESALFLRVGLRNNEAFRPHGNGIM